MCFIVIALASFPFVLCALRVLVCICGILVSFFFGAIEFFLASSCQCGLEGSRRIVGGEESMVIQILSQK